MPSVDLTELLGALELVSDKFTENEAYVCRQTGNIYWIFEDGVVEQEEPPDDLSDADKYAPVPDKYELDVGNRLAFDFTTLHLPDRYDEVRSIFRRQGAYSRFKALLAEHQLLDAWYSYSETQTLEALRDWCTSEGFDAEFRERSSA
jgi:hypothetical protein